MGGLSSGRKPMMAGFVSADIFSPLSYEDIKKRAATSDSPNHKTETGIPKKRCGNRCLPRIFSDILSRILRRFFNVSRCGKYFVAMGAASSQK
jgi:hypothetical protein